MSPTVQGIFSTPITDLEVLCVTSRIGRSAILLRPLLEKGSSSSFNALGLPLVRNLVIEDLTAQRVEFRTKHDEVIGMNATAP